jgi:hypothetical protein
MRVEREPSCSAEKNSGTTGRWLRIQASAAASLKLKCSQMKSPSPGGVACAAASQAWVSSSVTGAPVPPPQKR